MNVRILATTNRDLPAEVQRGTFREDLYFRLNVVSLRIPPLRERPGDIAALAEHFARRYADVNGLPFRPLSREALLRLDVACLAGQCARAGERDPPRRAARRWRGRSASRRSSSGRPRRAQRPAERLRAGGIASLVGRRMEEVERDLIIETLGHTLGNRTHAATILGISIRALRNKLRDYAAQGVAVPRPPPAWRREVTMRTKKVPSPQPPPARGGGVNYLLPGQSHFRIVPEAGEVRSFPACAHELAAQRSFGGVLLHDLQRHMAQHGQILCGQLSRRVLS